MLIADLQPLPLLPPRMTRSPPLRSLSPLLRELAALGESPRGSGPSRLSCVLSGHRVVQCGGRCDVSGHFRVDWKGLRARGELELSAGASFAPCELPLWSLVPGSGSWSVRGTYIRHLIRKRRAQFLSPLCLSALAGAEREKGGAGVGVPPAPSPSSYLGAKGCRPDAA